MRSLFLYQRANLTAFCSFLIKWHVMGKSVVIIFNLGSFNYAQIFKYKTEPLLIKLVLTNVFISVLGTN